MDTADRLPVHTQSYRHQLMLRPILFEFLTKLAFTKILSQLNHLIGLPSDT